jgi:hypothetical protein
MKKLYKVTFLIISISFFTGFQRIVDWGKDHFNQGIPLDKEATFPKEHIRSIFIYDEFTTVGNFSVMWLSNTVRKAYADVYSRTNNYSIERAKEFLKNQLKMNEHYISFYVLVDRTLLKNKILSDNNVEWKFALKIDNERYIPVEIDLVELAPEYTLFFGKYINLSKDAYILKFDAKNITGKKLLNKDVTRLELEIKSVDREGRLIWCLDKKGRITKCQKKPFKSKYEIRK